MPNELEKAHDRFIGYICSVCDDFGLNRFVAQLYGILYMSDRSLSLDELAEKSGSSKGNVSINIRELEKWGAVKNIWVKGSRKDYYEAELDIKKIFANKLKTSMQKRIADVSDMLEEFKDTIRNTKTAMTAEEKNLTKIYEERLKKIEELKRLAVSALSLAEKFL